MEAEELELVMVDCEERMDKCVESFKTTLSKVKTGRANASLVKDIEVDYWGAPTPLYQMANISTPDATQIVVKPYDKGQLKNVEKAIIMADLGFTPLNDGTVIRCPVPQLTGEVRQKLVKDCYKLSEEAKVSVRNVRRDVIADLKKDKTIPEDTEKSMEEDVQKLTDKAIAKIEDLVKAKEKELTTI